MDPDRLERAREGASGFFARGVKLGKLAPELAGAALARLRFTHRVEELCDSQLVIEAIFENFDAKAALLRKLDAITPPSAILSSNTSTLSITRLAAASGRPDRFIGLHFCLPAQLMRLVEITPGLMTSDDTLARAQEFCASAGQIGIRTQDTPGFILNYFAIPLNNDAIRLMESGVATAQAIDRAVCTGMGYSMGPLQLVDLVGLDTQERLCAKRSIKSRRILVTPAPLSCARWLPQDSWESASEKGSTSTRTRPCLERSAMQFKLIDTGGSRSFPAEDIVYSLAACAAPVLLIVGRDAGRMFRSLDPMEAKAARAVLIERGTEYLGVHSEEAAAGETSRVFGFARFRLGFSAPSPLVELVCPPLADPTALELAQAVFERLGLMVACCSDTAGRILDRLMRPYFNSALHRLDDGLATPAVLDRALKLGLGYPRGPIELLNDSGLEHHHDICSALCEMLADPGFRPARRAQIAAARRNAAAKESS